MPARVRKSSWITQHENRVDRDAQSSPAPQRAFLFRHEPVDRIYEYRVSRLTNARVSSSRSREMKLVRFRIQGLALAIATISACASAGGFREDNIRNLDRLRVGMTRDQVFDIMGTKTVSVSGTEDSGPVGIGEDTLGVSQVQIPVGGPKPVLQNPHRNELYRAGGANWEVLYYYTSVVSDDGMVTDDELTPVVLREDTLTGWGWEYLAEQASLNDIPVEIPTFGDSAPPQDSSSASISSMIPSIRLTSAR